MTNPEYGDEATDESTVPEAAAKKGEEPAAAAQGEDTEFPKPGDHKRPRGLWTKRVKFSATQPFAFAPNEILVTGADAVQAAIEIANEITSGGVKFGDEVPIIDGEFLLKSESPFDVEDLVAELRHRGFGAEPNYVFFVHSCGCASECGCAGAGSHPFQSNPFQSNPFQSNPFQSNPFQSNPFQSNPFQSNPFQSNPFQSNFVSNPFQSNPFQSNPFQSNRASTTGERSSSALPADDPMVDKPSIPSGKAKVIIFDTGIAEDLPALLQRPSHQNAEPEDREFPDESNDQFLDPVSGHGTFIAGVIEMIAPRQRVHAAAVMTTFGEGKASLIAGRLDDIRKAGFLDENTIVNMSFGAYADQDMRLLAKAIRLAQREGAVIVASAGNDNTSRHSYPACLPGVVSVASVEGYGKAHYSNYGDWVRACAPGSKVVSAFFNDFDGKAQPLPNSIDPDHFKAWAEWSGTSFAAPAVAAALARHIATTGQNANEAVAALIDNPALLRLPCLGTVVNVAPGPIIAPAP